MAHHTVITRRTAASSFSHPVSLVSRPPRHPKPAARGRALPDEAAFFRRADRARRAARTTSASAASLQWREATRGGGKREGVRGGGQTKQHRNTERYHRRSARTWEGWQSRACVRVREAEPHGSVASPRSPRAVPSPPTRTRAGGVEEGGGERILRRGGHGLGIRPWAPRT